MRFFLVSFLSVWSVAASAEPQIEVAPPVKLDGAPPSVTIVQPAQHAQLVTHRTASPDDKYDSLDCLLDGKDRAIRVSATNWPVKPNGPGILVVVDGIWATVVHDTTKPIRLDQLQAYLPFFKGHEGGPMSSCSWHWVAAVPTTADGRMVAVAPAVNWYFNVAERSGDNNNADPSKPPDDTLVIVNWPLVGAFVLGEGPDGSQDATGRVATTPDRVPIDYVVLNNGDCSGLEVYWGQSHIVHDELRALVYLEPSPRDETFEWEPKCTRGGRSNRGHGQLFIYSHSPKPQPGETYAWPASGKQKVDDNYFGENKNQVNQQIRRARCKDGHKESCD